MPEVLSQEEVDALLSAVSEVSMDLAGEGERRPARQVSVYDFKRPERLSKDQMRALETHHEVMARSLSATLSGALRTVVECRLSAVEQLTYTEFVMSLPNPTCFNVLTAEPLEGKLIIEINHSIVFPIIDKLLGGGAGPSSLQDREMTQIESRLFARVIERILVHLREAWAPICRLNPKVVQTESNPQLLPVAAPNEVVALVGFEVRLGDVSGTMNLCIPYPAIEPVLGQFSAVQGWYGPQRGAAEDSASGERIRASIRNALLDVTVCLAGADISVRDMLELYPGQLLVTDKPASSPLILTVAGRAKFVGRPGTFRGKKALAIVRAARPEDRL